MFLQLGRIAARSSGRGDPKAQQLTPGLVVFKRQRGMHTIQCESLLLGCHAVSPPPHPFHFAWVGPFAGRSPATDDATADDWTRQELSLLHLPQHSRTSCCSATHTPSNSCTDLTF